MSATDELRRLLDERGVEYETDDHMGYSETRWDDACAFQLAPGAGLVMAVTPEQAVEATLGPRTCAIDSWGGDNAMLTCGHEAPGYAKFCPECGAKVVEE